MGWATDLHLNFVAAPARAEFYSRIKNENLDVLLVGGDIGESDSVETYLSELEQHLQIPIYFVLGNHDFYGSSIKAVRARIREFTRGSRHLRWLSDSGVVAIDSNTAIVGHDSWADARYGDFFGSDVLLNDFFFIAELCVPTKTELLTVVRKLGDEAALHLRTSLREALEKFTRVIVLTHVPPFRESCWHEGRISGEDWLPHFTCKAVGDVVFDAAKEKPDCAITVLCGHTHGGGFCRVLDNLDVHTGAAQYRAPTMQHIFEL